MTRMHRLLRTGAAPLLILFAALSAFAETAKRPPLKPLRTDTPPVIDGVLDDAVWKNAPSERDFKTYMPDFGKDMREATIIYYAYDRENLYFAYRCFDKEPSKIKASVAARDTILRDDWVCLNLDPFNDQQSLYTLYVNPLGIQADAGFAAGQEDFSLDLVWYSAGRIDAEGYTVEIRIPFKSIRYRRKEPVEMGIIFERRVSRQTEAGTLPPLDPAQGANFQTQTRPLSFTDIRHYTLLEILPAVTWGRKSRIEEGALRAGKADSTLSLTAKYGLTSQLVLDGTVNPDFSQVESDAGQVDFNLRYALIYPEKRPFFLEGRENFNFGGMQSDDALQAIVHTRTIIDPSFGLKLNGKVSARDKLASIYAIDEVPGGGQAHFTIVRYKHALSDDSYVGGFWTGRFEGARFNIVAGSDGQLRVSPAAQFGYHALMSQTKAGGGAEETEGHALSFDFMHSTRDFTFYAAAQDLSRDFETETGYLTRNGLTRFKIGILPTIYPKSKWLLRVDPIFHTINIRDKFSGLWETLDSFDLRAILPQNTTLILGGRYATEIFNGVRLDRSGVRFNASTQLNKQWALSLVSLYGGKIRYVDSPYQGRGLDLRAAVTYLPSDKLHFEGSWIRSDFFRSEGGAKEFEYSILRGLTTYQVNKYLFFRAIVEYNSFYKNLITDFLASFTYIPGTVIHVGYGSAYEKIAWRDGDYVPADRFLETERGFFFKASYLWRL